jgi:hypothetical protein
MAFLSGIENALCHWTGMVWLLACHRNFEHNPTGLPRLLVSAILRAGLLTGSTSRVTEMAYFRNAQGVPVKRSVPIPVAHSVSFFLTQTGGTGRAFDWSILSL